MFKKRTEKKRSKRKLKEEKRKLKKKGLVEKKSEEDEKDLSQDIDSSLNDNADEEDYEVKQAKNTEEVEEEKKDQQPTILDDNKEELNSNLLNIANQNANEQFNSTNFNYNVPILEPNERKKENFKKIIIHDDDF